MDWDYLRSVFPELLDGLRITAIATGVGMVLAVVVGLLLACVQVLRVPVLRHVAAGWILFIRNTPLLVQLFFLFYVLPRYGVLIDALTLGIVGLGLHFSCYTAEAFRGGFLSVPKGQWEAARTLNLSTVTTLRTVILPQAIPPVLAALGNNLISMFKDSAVLSAITVLELLGVTRKLASTSFQYTTLLTVMGVMYLTLALPASFAIRAIERRISRKEARS
ncbi:ectoine/hydroxyectoine ABC transporter permease subunit EhuD [Dactylosporangium sp. AC04546]|uniref:ectoine/hydroxyectoine ABC transporter permease subunit EhuD n=1 Tax=Dactylosporangium sp. AC04546 TaxID=2862460 RepID=UPI001EDFECD3|nr:ectoine/hydroxyectoine ABC transporter permease subunit EhuD [Dactylosporangium sp. AC04546]WVK86595.1 ectoine/hydroxyectoine ABC transporter permease subunit EhuD [Dactylosporangium sp. AC04546]